jgi:hypothetical protein
MTPEAAIAMIRKHDAAKIYDSLERWQQKELVCIMRKACQETAVKVQLSLAKRQK